MSGTVNANPTSSLNGDIAITTTHRIVENSEYVSIQMDENAESLESDKCDICDSHSHKKEGKSMEQSRDWRYWSLYFAVSAAAITLGFVVSHYITVFFFGAIAGKAVLGTIGAKLAATKIGAKVIATTHHYLGLRTVGGQCCCCSCGGCNGCCPCGNACCSCAC